MTVSPRLYPQKFPNRDTLCTHRQCIMGWLRLVGSLKSQVSFGEDRLFNRALLQKNLSFQEPTNRSHLIYTFNEGMTVSTENASPQNSSNRETQISRYHAEQIQIRSLI